MGALTWPRPGGAATTTTVWVRIARTSPVTSEMCAFQHGPKMDGTSPGQGTWVPR